MWKLSFLAVIWTIWKESEQCFDGRPVDYLQLVDRVMLIVASWIVRLALFWNIPMSTVMSKWKEVAFSNPVKPCMPTRWIPPPAGVFKLNFDGSAHGNPGRASLGGLVRDSNGHILFSYSALAGLCTLIKLSC